VDTPGSDTVVQLPPSSMLTATAYRRVAGSMPATQSWPPTTPSARGVIGGWTCNGPSSPVLGSR